MGNMRATGATRGGRPARAGNSVVHSLQSMTTKARRKTDIPGIKLRRSLRVGPYQSGDQHLAKAVWSPDGRILAIPTQAGSVQLWNPDSASLEREIAVRIG